MTVRAAARSAVLAATTAVLLWGLSPTRAAAVGRDDGSETGDGLSILETLFYFVGIPLALYVGIAVLVTVTSSARGPRYRPGLGWWAAPVWFNGPDSAENAVRDATPTVGGGGASARW